MTMPQMLITEQQIDKPGPQICSLLSFVTLVAISNAIKLLYLVYDEKLIIICLNI